jgi:hypothetical protein
VTWKLVNIVMDGQPISIGGVNPWKHAWVQTSEEPVEVPHPTHPSEIHKMRQYKIVTPKKEIIFAAGEFSNCVWGFYVPA